MRMIWQFYCELDFRFTKSDYCMIHRLLIIAKNIDFQVPKVAEIVVKLGEGGSQFFEKLCEIFKNFLWLPFHNCTKKFNQSSKILASYQKLLFTTLHIISLMLSNVLSKCKCYKCKMLKPNLSSEVKVINPLVRIL